MAKVLISVDDRLLNRIDRMAKASGLSRSAYLTGLAERDAEAAAGRAAITKRAALHRLDIVFAKAPSAESTSEVRAERDRR